MWIFALIVALVLAWPTMGLSLVIWLLALVFNLRGERRINELRHARHVTGGAAAPRPEVISKGIRSILDHMSALNQNDAADVYRTLDVTSDGDTLDPSTEADYLRAAARYGLRNIDALATHMMTIATVARQKSNTPAVQEASLRSVLYWCLENGASIPFAYGIDGVLIPA